MGRLVTAGVFVSCVVALAGLLQTPDPGWAHADLVKSSPARRAVLIRAPAEVQHLVLFTLPASLPRLEELDRAWGTISLAGARVIAVPMADAADAARPPAPGVPDRPSGLHPGALDPG